jgi:regulatory protein
MPFKRPKKTYDAASLYEYAIGALGRKMRAVAELKRLLRERVRGQEDAEVLVEAVVIKLKEQKYLNDSAYAAAYSANRRDNERFGRLRVITDLKQRGVHGDVIDQAVGAAYDDVNEEKLARAYLQRKRLQKPKTQRDAARIFRALSRAGFPARISLKILRHWDVDDEVLSALEEESSP